LAEIINGALEKFEDMAEKKMKEKIERNIYI
jgi:hypothetical protein